MADYSLLIAAGVLAIALAFAFSVGISKQDRARIRENIESSGGKVIEILKHWGWRYGGRGQRAYDVSYITSRGVHVKAVCITSGGSGVYWVSNHPPGDDGPYDDEVI